MTDHSRSGTRALASNNPKLRRLRRLVGRSKARADEAVLVVEGPQLVDDAIRSGLDIQQIFAAPGLLADLTSAHPDISAHLGQDVELYEVEHDVLAAILDPVNAQPVVAVVAQPQWTLEAVLARPGPLLVAIELRDPGNLGTIIRTAEAAGFGGLVIVGPSVDRFNPKVVRASAGSVLRLAIASAPDPEVALGALRESGRSIVATVVDRGAAPYDEVALAQAAVLVGNEPHGLAVEVVAQADRLMTIPMAPDVESLNVAAAAAVICFEAARQHRLGLRPTAPDQTATGKSVAHGSDSAPGWSQ